MVEKENAIRRSSLPKAQSTTAPETAIRFAVFGTPDIINNLDENDMSESSSGIPVRLVSANNLSELRQKIEMVCMNNIQTIKTSNFLKIGTIHHSRCMFT